MPVASAAQSRYGVFPLLAGGGAGPQLQACDTPCEVTLLLVGCHSFSQKQVTRAAHLPLDDAAGITCGGWGCGLVVELARPWV